METKPGKSAAHFLSLIFSRKTTLGLPKAQGPACARLGMPEEEVATLPGGPSLRLGLLGSETGSVERGGLADDRS